MCAVVSSVFSTSTYGVSCVELPLFTLCFAASIPCAQTVETSPRGSKDLCLLVVELSGYMEVFIYHPYT